MKSLVRLVDATSTTFKLVDQGLPPDGYHLGKQAVYLRTARLIHVYETVDGVRRYIGKRWTEEPLVHPSRRKTHHVEWLTENGLKPESSAMYYIDVLRRGRLPASDPRSLQKINFNNALRERNTPKGYVYYCSPNISEVPAPSLKTSRPFNHKDFGWNWNRSKRQQKIEAEAALEELRTRREERNKEKVQ